MDSPYGLHRIGVAQYTGYSLVYRSFEEPYPALPFAPPPRLRMSACGETMTTPGGAGTPLPKAQLQPPRVRRTGFSHRVGVSSGYRAPALRYAHGPMPQGQPALTFAE
jgi:hypothetical protein